MQTELATKEKTARANAPMIKQAISLAKMPTIIAFLITPVRFLLELSGLPENTIFIIGLLWFTLGFSIYLGFKLYCESKAIQILLLTLLLFAPISRIPVAILWWIDTELAIGTHYGFYFDNFPQALLNHIIYGSLIQILPGFILGSITLILLKNSKSVK